MNAIRPERPEASPAERLARIYAVRISQGEMAFSTAVDALRRADQASGATRVRTTSTVAGCWAQQPFSTLAGYQTLNEWGSALHCMNWVIRPPKPPLHSLVRPLRAEWQGTLCEAVTTWRNLLAAMPSWWEVWAELGEAENRLRHVAVGTTGR